MPKIKSITCQKILNSRGDWTIETKVTLDDGSEGSQAIPDGASKGENEAVYIPVDKAVDIVSTAINDVLEGEDPTEQIVLDKILLDMDGTTNKKHLGGNSILSVSLAAAKASAKSKGLELYEYLARLYTPKKDPSAELKFPVPIFNIINGGLHSHNNLSFQEFMAIPSPSLPFDKALEMGVKVYHNLKEILIKDGLDVDVGDEGGFAPNNLTTAKALQYISKAASQSYKLGEQIFMGMDVAAGSFYMHDAYLIKEEKKTLNSEKMSQMYVDLLTTYPLIYLEDPFYESDADAWAKFTKSVGSRLMVVGDDLVVTNPKFLKSAIDRKLANAVIVKPNQVGTLTETFEFVRNAQQAGMKIIVSHRSGETGEDTFIADLAIAVGADFIKSGAPVRGERVVKYNRLLQIFNAQKN